MGLNTPVWLVVGFALLLSAIATEAQGTFQNLNFEQARVSPTPVNGSGGDVDPALAFPGWTESVVWRGTNTYALFTFYNNQAIDSPAIVLIGPAFPNRMGLASLQGSYSVALQYSSFWNAFPVLSQTGLVPADAKSVSLLVPSGSVWWQWPRMALGGVDINLVPVAGGRLAGDVSAFAGAIANLSFTPGSYFSYFDDIRFSNLPVPEPGVFGLSALGALVLGWRVRKRWR